MNVGNINVLSSSLIYFDEKYCPTSFSVTSVNNSMINGKCAITNGVTATVKYYIQCNYKNCTNYMG